MNPVRTILIVLIFSILLPTEHAAAVRTVKAGVYNVKPMVYVDPDGIAQGIFVEVLNHVAQQEGWDLQYIPGTWNEGLERLKNGEIDLMVFISYSEEREKYLDFPKDYLQMDWGQLYKPKGSDINSLLDLEGKTVAVLKGSIFTAGFQELLQQFAISVNLLEMQEINDIFEALDSGHAEAGVTANIYGILNARAFNVEWTPVIFTPVKNGYAVQQGENGDLIAALNDHIAEQKADLKSIYHQKSAELTGGGRSGLPKEIYWGFFGFAGSLLAALFFIWLLRQQVRKKTRSVIESAEHYKTIIQSTTDGFWRVNLAGKILDINDRYADLSGYSRVELLEMSIVDLDALDSLEEVKANIEILKKTRFKRFESKHRRKDGSLWEVEISTAYMPITNEIVVFSKDITEKKKAEAEVARRRAEFEAIFNSISDGIVFVDPQRHIVNINPAFTLLLGYQLEEIAGQTTRLIYADPDHYGKQGRARFNPEAKIDRPVFENEYRRKDGTTFHGETIGAHVVDRSGELLGFIGVIRDVTERKLAEKQQEELEQKLAQAHKMEAIGTMAGGIAHDFNNLLAIIGGNLEIMQFKQQSGTPFGENLEYVSQATLRAKNLVAQILNFSRQKRKKHEPVDLSAIIGDSPGFLRPIIPTTVELLTEGPDVPVPINGDTTQLQQILMNLCSNALHAMNDKGSLRIKLEEGTLTKLELSRIAEPRAGRYAKLSLSDTGSGMDKETMGRIFDPFYTTKEVGVGTGMGLSVVHGIMQQHGGFILLDSTLGQGTMFTLYFPVINVVNSAEEEQVKEPLRTGTEHILFVDDEQFVADAYCTLLEYQGYIVTVATSSIEALDHFKARPAYFDLVITDQTMPKMSGMELAGDLLKIRPDLPIILCSGYSAKVTEKIAKEAGISAFCMKPMTMTTLDKIIRNVLVEKSSLQLQSEIKS